MRHDERSIIIADDFTGACDTGVQLANSAHGCPVLVVGIDRAVDPGRAAELLAAHGRLVVDTESRHLRPEDAAARVAAVAADARDAAGVVYKKIDSTLRGNIGAEVEALAAVFPDRIVVVAPAFPAAGRTTESGLCLVNGVPVTETEFARDRLAPVRTARVADLFAGFERIDERAPNDLQDAIASAASGSVIVVNASSEDDLADGARAVADRLDRLILVGSAGFARALGSLVVGGSEPGHAPPGADPRRDPGPAPGSDLRAKARSSRPVVLGLVGSLSERSRVQARELASRGSVAALELRPAEITVQLADVVSLLSAGTDVLLVSPDARAASPAGRGAATAARIASLLGEIAAEAVRSVAGVRLFATGGDTALAAIRALGADAFVVRREVAPGVPVGTVDASAVGGRCDVQVVTKAGGFGDNGIMIEAFERLREDRCLQ